VVGAPDFEIGLLEKLERLRFEAALGKCEGDHIISPPPAKMIK